MHAVKKADLARTSRLQARVHVFKNWGLRTYLVAAGTRQKIRDYALTCWLQARVPAIKN